LRKIRNLKRKRPSLPSQAVCQDQDEGGREIDHLPNIAQPIMKTLHPRRRTGEGGERNYDERKSRSDGIPRGVIRRCFRGTLL